MCRLPDWMTGISTGSSAGSVIPWPSNKSSMLRPAQIVEQNHSGISILVTVNLKSVFNTTSLFSPKALSSSATASSATTAASPVLYFSEKVVLFYFESNLVKGEEFCEKPFPFKVALF